MKSWWLLALLLVPGGSILAIAAYLHRRLAREKAEIDRLIGVQKKGLYYTYLGHDEALDVRARLRKDIADRKRQQAAAVESGGTSADFQKIARRA